MDLILSYLAPLLAHAGAIFQAIGALVVCASTIVKLTPSLKDDAVLAKVIKFLDHFSVFNPNAPK